MRKPKLDIGTVLMMGISSTSLKAREKSLLSKLGIGGVILFRRNYENPRQLASLMGEIYKASKGAVPLIGVDQEGGRVIRFGEPFTQFPPSESLGRYYEKKGSLHAAKEYASITATELKGFGLNLCFAPVADILTNPTNTVIGSRAFSKKTDTVAKLTRVVIKGFMDEGVIPCAKHFPGHGDTILDSHHDLPRVWHDASLLAKREFQPFKGAIKAGVPMIMTAHILYSAFDTKYPATLSENVVKGILRGKLDFDGVVISDDFDMKGLSLNYGFDEAIVRAVQATVDIIMICGQDGKIEEAFETLTCASEKYPSFAGNISESITRISKMKFRFKLKEIDISYKKALKKIDRERSNKILAKLARI